MGGADAAAALGAYLAPDSPDRLCEQEQAEGRVVVSAAQEAGLPPPIWNRDVTEVVTLLWAVKVCETEDAHKRYSVFVRLHEDGKTEPPLRVEHEREQFRAYLNSLGEAADIAVESSRLLKSSQRFFGKAFLELSRE